MAEVEMDRALSDEKWRQYLKVNDHFWRQTNIKILPQKYKQLKLHRKILDKSWLPILEHNLLIPKLSDNFVAQRQELEVRREFEKQRRTCKVRRAFSKPLWLKGLAPEHDKNRSI